VGIKSVVVREIIIMMMMVMMDGFCLSAKQNLNMLAFTYIYTRRHTLVIAESVCLRLWINLSKEKSQQNQTAML